MFKKIMYGVSCVLIMFVLLIVGTYIYHTAKVDQERDEFLPIGEMVEVNDHEMHVYTEGEGEHRIVFLSGGGTSAPTLDFKPLWSLLTDDYEIAVVEKAGYGWSEVADVSRDIDSILHETRTALLEAGVDAPYVLAAHSMSGLEAIRWAQKYPEEVEAIIGLDAAVPEVYDVLDIPSTFVQSLGSFAARAGILRVFPSAMNQSAAIDSGNLSEIDEDTYRALFHQSTLTKNMVDEAKEVAANAQKVKDDSVPEKTPMYFFISNGDEIGLDDWEDISVNYVQQADHHSYKIMGPEHYIHTYKPEVIAEEMDNFIKEIKK